MKKTCFALSVILLMLFLASCVAADSDTGGNASKQDPVPEATYLLPVNEVNFWGYEMPPDTDLDFWIADMVTEDDFSEYEFVAGSEGSVLFKKAGKENEDGGTGEVYYEMSYFPINDFRKDSTLLSFVNEIIITDPDVRVFGLNPGVSKEEFERTMLNFKFTPSESGFVSPDGRYTVSLIYPEIRIKTPVVNREYCDF